MEKINSRIADDAILAPYLKGDGLAFKTKALLAQQLDNCEAIRNGYEALSTVQIKSFQFDGFEIKVQFNPGRIKSSSAKVDKKSVEERPCFLCNDNLLDGQLALEYYKDYFILCNPFPIYNEHFTIPKVEHLPQLIKGKLNSMLNLSKGLSQFYSVLYNGPQCGASAPDHMHFQAGNKNFLPIEEDYKNLKGSLIKPLYETEEISAYASNSYIRDFIAFESNNRDLLISEFDRMLNLLQIVNPNPIEPMLNALAFYEEEKWILIIFPRSKHRPEQYFADGDDKILFSPAALDLGGVCITPRQKDFEKITKDDIVDMLKQVCLSKEQFIFITEKIKRKTSD